MLKILVNSFKAPLDARTFSALIKGLPLHMQTKAHAYQRWQDANAYVIGKLMLQYHLEHAGRKHHELKDVSFTQFNRPVINGSNGDFNLSHSGEYVVGAFYQGSKIGIDIERIKIINPDEFSLVFRADELEQIKGNKDVLQAFYRLWTIKEAVVKADGRGLLAPVKQVKTSSFENTAELEQTVWHVRTLDIAPEYCCAIATDRPLGASEISIQHLNFQSLIRHNALYAG